MKGLKNIRFKRAVLAIAALGFLAVCQESTWAGVQTRGVNVTYHTQEEIRAYEQQHRVSREAELIFQKEPVLEEPFEPGVLSDDTQQAALTMLKQIRYIAGVSDQVTLSEDYIKKANAASLINYLNDEMTHYPKQPQGVPDDLYQLAKDGARHSNLAWSSGAGSSLNEMLTHSWMSDEDSSNINRVGHRRWLIYPQLSEVGFGAVSGPRGSHSAVYVVGTKRANANQSGVAWPAQNMPTEYFGAEFPWSISMGHKINESAVQVILTRVSDRKSWYFSKERSDGAFFVNNDNYGQAGCIIFRPDPESIGEYRDGDVYEVVITGDTQPISYEVHFFNLMQLEGIHASYIGSSVELDDELSDLKNFIDVEAQYSDGMMRDVSDFTIEPCKMQVGNNQIRVTYQDKSAVVTVKAQPSDIRTASLKLKSGRKLILRFGSAVGADGYQVRYSTDKNFANARTKKVSATARKMVLKNLKKGRHYYFEIRAYGLDETGGRVYGNGYEIETQI